MASLFIFIISKKKLNLNLCDNSFNSERNTEVADAIYGGPNMGFAAVSILIVCAYNQYYIL